MGSKVFGSLLGEILFSNPLNPTESASIKIATGKRIDFMDHAEYQKLMLKSLEKAKPAPVAAKPASVIAKPAPVIKHTRPIVAKPAPAPVKPAVGHVSFITGKPVVLTRSKFLQPNPVIQPKAQAKPVAIQPTAKIPMKKTINAPATAHANWVSQTAPNTANTSTWIQEQLQKQSKVSQQQFNDKRKRCEAVQQNIIETKKKQLAELQRNASSHYGGVAYHGPVGVVGPQTLNCMHTINAATRQVAAPVYCRPAGSNANLTFYPNQNAAQACHPQATMNFVRKF
jgi:hypothetical protein